MKRGGSEHELAMLRVAQMYYESNLTQDQIARRLTLTRWKVGRLLDDAREAGIVRIEIVHPRARHRAMEAALVEKFGIREAVVVPAEGPSTELRRRVATAAAEYLTDLRPRCRVLGVSWGRTLDAIADALPPNWAKNVEVMQINGALSRSRRPSTGADIASTIAHKGTGTVSLLPAPAILEKASTKAALEHEPTVQEILSHARAADVLVLSAGALSRESVLVESGYLSVTDVERLRSLGAVGDVLGRFVDEAGVEVDPDLSARTLGLTLDDLRGAHRSVVVASGREKVGIARAAAATHLCSALVTDSDVATSLLEDS